MISTTSIRRKPPAKKSLRKTAKRSRSAPQLEMTADRAVLVGRMYRAAEAQVREIEERLQDQSGEPLRRSLARKLDALVEAGEGAVPDEP